MAKFLRARDFRFPTTHFKSFCLFPVRRLQHSGSTSPELCNDAYSDFIVPERQVADPSKWKKVNARLCGITSSMIPSPPWTVLKILRYRGFESYLVGGCVRDLLLNKEPKDFDVITTAKLTQVKKEFRRCYIIGQRFPICKVLIQGTSVEVSSFETVSRHAEEKENVHFSKMPDGCDEKDFIRWRDCMHRDFTINSLFYDPFKNVIYDYANGMADLKTLELRTLIPAQLSFEEDCARILRGLRIAGRLGLSISKDTVAAIHKHSSSISGLGKFRMMMEMNYMLSYGAAESTISLLQRFHLLEKFLPFHAAYLDQQAGEKSASSGMMMKLFFNLDKLFSCERPCTCTVWVGLLAFHQAVAVSPQDGLVIWVFASVLYHGDWKKGIRFARENAKMQVASEISGFYEGKSDEELAEEVGRLASLVQDSADALIDAESLSKYMSRFPVSSCSGSVFIPERIGKRASKLFDMLLNDIESCKKQRVRSEIDYRLLEKGDLHETRFALGKVILETLRGKLYEGLKVVNEEQEVIGDKVYRVLNGEWVIEEKGYEVLKEGQTVEEKGHNKEGKAVEEKGYLALSHFVKRLVTVKDGILETLTGGIFQGAPKVLKGEHDVIQEKGYPENSHKPVEKDHSPLSHKVVMNKNKKLKEVVITEKFDLPSVSQQEEKKDCHLLEHEVSREKTEQFKVALVEEEKVSAQRGNKWSLTSSLEPKQGEFKEQQLVKLEGCAEQDAATEEVALVLKNVSQQMVKKPKLLDIIQFPRDVSYARQGSDKGHSTAKIEKNQYLACKLTKKVGKGKRRNLHEGRAMKYKTTLEETISKDDKIKQEELNRRRGSLSEKIESLKEKQHVLQLRMNDEGHLAVKTQKHQDQARKPTKMVDKVRCNKLHDGKAVEMATRLEKSLSKDGKSRTREKKDHHSLSQEVIRNKTEKLEEQKDQPSLCKQEEKQDHRQLLHGVFREESEQLSSLFVEKKVQPSLSKLFQR